MSEEFPTGRPLRLLRMLYARGKPVTIYTIEMKQDELAKQLGISRQALNVHMRKLRDYDYIRTGRGFIDITEKGLRVLGVSINPAFVFVKISPYRREKTYEKITDFPIERAFRVTGDMDAILVVEREKLDETLKKLASLEGVEATKSYVTIQTVK